LSGRVPPLLSPVFRPFSTPTPIMIRSSRTLFFDHCQRSETPPPFSLPPLLEESCPAFLLSGDRDFFFMLFHRFPLFGLALRRRDPSVGFLRPAFLTIFFLCPLPLKVGPSNVGYRHLESRWALLIVSPTSPRRHLFLASLHGGTASQPFLPRHRAISRKVSPRSSTSLISRLLGSMSLCVPPPFPPPLSRLFFESGLRLTDPCFPSLPFSSVVEACLPGFGRIKPSFSTKQILPLDLTSPPPEGVGCFRQWVRPVP